MDLNAKSCYALNVSKLQNSITFACMADALTYSSDRILSSLRVKLKDPNVATLGFDHFQAVAQGLTTEPPYTHFTAKILTLTKGPVIYTANIMLHYLLINQASTGSSSISKCFWLPNHKIY